MELLCCAGSTSIITIKKVCKKVGIRLHRCPTTEEACQLVSENSNKWIGIVTALGQDEDTECWKLLKFVRQLFPSIYIIVYSYTAQCGDDLAIRLECFKSGAKMVTYYESALDIILRNLIVEMNTMGALTCPYCQKKKLSEDTLHLHLELYHTYESNIDLPCPICGLRRASNRGGLAVHYHNSHGPLERREKEKYIPSCLTAFALVVCQRKSDGKFLLIQEPLGIGGGYWVPAGRVDPGETLTTGGVRETLEEAGIHIEIKSVLKVILSDALRIIYLAYPVDGTDDTPKTVPDFESAGAMWVSVRNVKEKLTPSLCRSGRATEPLEWFPKVADGRRGISINNAVYAQLEEIALEFGQKQCTPCDINEQIIPAVKNINRILNVDNEILSTDEL